MDQLIQANLQIIELLSMVFEEVERQGAGGHGPSTNGRTPRLRAWVGRQRSPGPAPVMRDHISH